MEFIVILQCRSIRLDSVRCSAVLQKIIFRQMRQTGISLRILGYDKEY